MDSLVILPEGKCWCLRCGRCRRVDVIGYCRECSYMAAGREPDALDQVIQQLEATREAAAEAGLEDLFVALVRAQMVLTYLAREFGPPRPTGDGAADERRAG